MTFEVLKATKVQAKARIALEGPAGSGKTYSALVLARELGSKVVVIDTERRSAAKYAKEWKGFEYDVIPLDPPYTPDRYTEAVKFAEAQGFDVIVIDSLSHAWAGEGGALEMVDTAKVKFGGNSYYAWRDVTPKHNKLIDTMLASPAHIIGCMRTKVQYTEDKSGGKTAYRKVGTQAIQREGMDYEFDIVFTLDYEHHAIVSKTRFNEIADRVYQPIVSDLGKVIRGWCDEGAPAPEPVKTQADLIEYAKNIGIVKPVDIKETLEAGGISGFDPEKWDETIAVLDASVA